MEALILLDTTELLCVMPRKLHAAWAELCGTKARMPPTISDELAPAGVLQSRTAARFGFKPEPAVFQPDDQLVRWTRSTAAGERWIQAGMLASWPARDDAGAEQVIRATVEKIGTLVRTGGPLLNASARLLNELALENHPNPIDLVERTRRRFPSPTITTDRTHRSYPDAA